MNAGVKIQSIDEFKKLRDALVKNRTSPGAKDEIRICIGGGCIASGSLDVKSAFERVLGHKKLKIMYCMKRSSPRMPKKSSKSISLAVKLLNAWHGSGNPTMPRLLPSTR
jgi:hypothetical protein